MKKLLLNFLAILFGAVASIFVFISLSYIIKLEHQKTEKNELQKVAIVEVKPEPKKSKEIKKNEFLKEYKIKKFVKIKMSKPQINLPNIQTSSFETPAINIAKFDSNDIDLTLSNSLNFVSESNNLGNLEGSSFQGIATNLVPIYKETPTYPRQAKLMRKEGYIKFLLTIDTNGYVKSYKILESKPKYLFEQSATQSIQKWKFSPKYINGKAVEQQAIQVIEFKLN
jgi:protein TonB